MLGAGSAKPRVAWLQIRPRPYSGFRLHSPLPDLTEQELVRLKVRFLPECFVGSPRTPTKWGLLQVPRRELEWWDGGQDTEGIFLRLGVASWVVVHTYCPLLTHDVT